MARAQAGAILRLSSIQDRRLGRRAPFAGAGVTVSALYVAGDRDLVVAFRGMDQLIPNLNQFAPGLRQTIMLPGCGHWTQQGRAPGKSIRRWSSS